MSDAQIVRKNPCRRCGHSPDDHRLDDSLNLSPVDPGTPFRCIGSDWRYGCLYNCPDFVGEPITWSGDMEGGDRGEWLAPAARSDETAKMRRHLAYLLGQYERVIAMVRHIRMDTPEDRELSERAVSAMEEGAAPVRRVLDGERSELVARPDAATLRKRIAVAVDHQYADLAMGDCPSVSEITDAVMGVLAEHGLVEREARDG